ncbi:uncharacterized protein C8Q71DRAFT_771031 [Rhodofomes roseus]|uniref:SUN domain-containing protein n=1 Tax=Rhodofomes roseus TaxID=34475 RepID=A0ABQ8KAA7_9APHY|nr:uncharacterized protein C8Q71DRAFT_771031 [Rhodofomes roseus]KAH9834084.1 hypothetical protein C8Q71DRAFT_771031 [Rhodofomes roseus]
MRNDDTPYASRRFLYREDSAAWPAAGQGDKVVRFEPTNSLASEQTEPEARTVQRGANYTFVSILLAIVFLVLAILLQLSLRADIDFSQHIFHVLSLRGPQRHDPGSLLTPALRQAVEDIVMERIKAHVQAGRGQRDYALKAAGGRIAPDLTTGCTGMFNWECDAPNAAIDDDMRVGKCWNIHSVPAQLAIVLPEVILPSHVTVEHISKEIAPDIHVAPRNVTLWGIIDGKSNVARFEQLLRTDPSLQVAADRRPPIAKNHRYIPLSSFAYDIHAEEPMQTFAVAESIHSANITFAVFILEITDNWGGASTCLYRVRIHGTSP